MCSLSVSQPGSNFSIGPLPFSSFPVFSVEDELESSASAADAAGEADAAWGDAAWPGRCRYCEGACRRLLRFQEHSRWRQFGGEGRAKVAGQGLQVSSDAGMLLDAPASALAGGVSETASGEGGRSRLIQRCSPRPPPGRAIPTIPWRQTSSCPPATPPTTPELASAHAQALQHSSSHGPSSRSLGPTLTENIHRLRTKQVEKIALGPTCDPRVLEPKQLRRANIGAIIFQDFRGKPPPRGFSPS